MRCIIFAILEMELSALGIMTHEFAMLSSDFMPVPGAQRSAHSLKSYIGNARAC